MGRYLKSARSGVCGTSGDLELVCNEAVQSRGRGLVSTRRNPALILIGVSFGFPSTNINWRILRFQWQRQRELSLPTVPVAAAAAPAAVVDDCVNMPPT